MPSSEIPAVQTGKTANHKIAEELREAAKIPDTVAQLLNQTGVTKAVLVNMLMLAADIIDIYDEGGVDVNEWTSAHNLIRLLAGGELFAPGKPAPPPKPQLLVARGNDLKLRKGNTG